MLMTPEKKLKALFDIIMQEMKINEAFAEKINGLLGDEPKLPATTPKRGRRSPAVLNPFELYKISEDAMFEQLNGLDIDKLKDIIAEYGMDSAKLAMKWRKKERLLDLIIDTVKRRSSKGDVFR